MGLTGGDTGCGVGAGVGLTLGGLTGAGGSTGGFTTVGALLQPLSAAKRTQHKMNKERRMGGAIGQIGLARIGEGAQICKPLLILLHCASVLVHQRKTSCNAKD